MDTMCMSMCHTWDNGLSVLYQVSTWAYLCRPLRRLRAPDREGVTNAMVVHTTSGICHRTSCIRSQLIINRRGETTTEQQWCIDLAGTCRHVTNRRRPTVSADVVQFARLSPRASGSCSTTVRCLATSSPLPTVSTSFGVGPTWISINNHDSGPIKIKQIWRLYQSYSRPYIVYACLQFVVSPIQKYNLYGLVVRKAGG